MKKYPIPVLFLTLLFAPALFAGEYFQILSGEGAAFSLVRNGVRQELNLGGTDLNTILIGEGDSLLTGEGTFLELASGDLFLMVGENSALAVESLDREQGTLLSLSYGHLHILVKEAPPGEIWITGSDTVCLLSRGEYGFLLDYDMTLAQPEILSRIYSLDGRAQIRQRLADPASSGDKRVQYGEPVVIETGEMAVSSSWEKGLPLVPSFFDSDYAGYWAEHPFSGQEAASPLITLPGEGEEASRITGEVQDKIGVREVPDRDWDRLLLTGKAAFVLGALSMTGASLSYMAGEGPLGNILTGFGFFNLAIGAGAYGYTRLANPEYARAGE